MVETMEFIYFLLLGLAGILLHILAKFRDEITKQPKNGMKFKDRLTLVWSKFDVLGHSFYGLFALVIVIIVAAIRDDIQNIFTVTELSMIFVGYAADSVFKNLKPEKLK